MKKYLSILLAMLFVFGFAASALAIQADIPAESTAAIAAGATQVTLSGEIRVRYDWRHIGFMANDSQSEYSTVNERIRLGVDAKMSPNTEGMIQLTSETDTSNADPDNMPGGSSGAAVGSVGYTPTGAEGTFKAGNSFKGDISIRQMWILHQGTGLLGVNSGIKVGHMPLILGSGLFFDHSYFGDDALVAFVQPTKELELDAIVIDFSDANLVSGSSTTSRLELSDKNHGYVFVANYKPSKTTAVSLDVTYVDWQNLGDTATGDAAQTAAGVAGVIYPDLHLWNFGLRGNTEVSGITLKIDGELQTGTEQMSGVKATTATNLAGGSGNLDFSGFAVVAGAGVTVDPVKLDVMVGYGSGDDGKDNNKYKTFVTSQGPEGTFGDPYRGVGIQGGIQGPYAYNYRTVNAAGNSFGGLQNAYFVRLGGNADVMKDTNFDVGLFYLRAVDGITTLNAAEYGFSATNAAAAGYHASKDIGFETDARLTYKIDKGLVTWVEGGYLWAGDFWKAVAAVQPGTSPSNVYTMRTGIQLNF